MKHIDAQSLQGKAPGRRAKPFLALDLDRDKLAAMTRTMPLAQVFEAGARILKGETRFREADPPPGLRIQPGARILSK